MNAKNVLPAHNRIVLKANKEKNCVEHCDDWFFFHTLAMHASITTKSKKSLELSLKTKWSLLKDIYLDFLWMVDLSILTKHQSKASLQHSCIETWMVKKQCFIDLIQAHFLWLKVKPVWLQLTEFSFFSFFHRKKKLRHL